MSEMAASMSASSSESSASAAAGSRGYRERAEPIVQVVPKTPPFFLQRGDQPLPRTPQVGGEPDGVRRHPSSLTREIFQKPLIGVENDSPGARGARINCPTGTPW